MDEHVYIDINTTAKIIGVCPDTVRKLIALDGFPYIKIGKRYVINKNKLYNWLDNHEGKEVIIN
jgi:excisionase family DNA binding protein